jgi:hypothetical protein
MLGNHFHHNDDRDAEQHSPNAPQPAPKQLRNKHRRRIHPGYTTGGPGCDEHTHSGRY